LRRSHDSSGPDEHSPGGRVRRPGWTAGCALLGCVLSPTGRLEFSVKKAKALPHRNRRKSVRRRVKRKAKLSRARLRKSSGERSTYR